MDGWLVMGVVCSILFSTYGGAFCWARLPAWWPPIPMWPFVVAGFLFVPAMIMLEALANAVWPEITALLWVVAPYLFIPAMAFLAFILAIVADSNPDPNGEE